MSIAQLIQEIRTPPASIVEHRNDNNAPSRRLEQRRDVIVSDERDGSYWTEIRLYSMCTAARFRCTLHDRMTLAVAGCR
jgi:hypothetical protein